MSETSKNTAARRAGGVSPPSPTDAANSTRDASTGQDPLGGPTPPRSPESTPLAIVGIGCLFPKADGLESYWANIRSGVDAIEPIPATHWRPSDYFNPDPKAPDQTYAQRGGFIPPVDFNPLEFGISPNTLEATDTTQLLGIVVAQQALRDAGYAGPNAKPLDKNRVSVILGVTGTLELVIPLGARLGHPIWRKALKEAGVDQATADDVVQRISDGYVPWQENSFPGLLGNVAAGRIANKLDLGGTNCVVDAACASSLSAIHMAGLELAAGRCDVAISGGLDTFNDIFMYMCFSKTPALSPTGNARPFDSGADGTILGEGLGVVVLKRLADAQRDGDRIYAIIKSVGSSSDGKGNAIYAPSAPGQAKALRSAYKLAGIQPDTIELIEGHGTGTKVGDATEATALSQVMREAKADGTWCAIGSVKSQIGHTKAAAGVAGLIKAAMALHHKTLPPTVKVDYPVSPLATPKKADGSAPDVNNSPLYVNTIKRPWMPRADHPRRAGVSAFGFGGSNFHAVLEEVQAEKQNIDWDGNAQIFAFSADSPAALLTALAPLAACGLAAQRPLAAQSRTTFNAQHKHRLTLAVDLAKTDLPKLLASVKKQLEAEPNKSWSLPDGAFYATGPTPGKLAILFPGQGSQYVGMLRDLACQFPQVFTTLANADEAHSTQGARLTDRIYPMPAFTDEARAADDAALQNTAVAQPAIGAASLGAFRLLQHFGLTADAFAGHSFGELTALTAAGALDESAFHQLANARGTLMAGSANDAADRGAMLAVQAPIGEITTLLAVEQIDVIIANKNAPKQAVLSGSTAAIAQAEKAFSSRKIRCKKLPVSAAFHSPAVAGAAVPFAKAIAGVKLAAPTVPVYANTTAQPYPADVKQIASLLANQLANPVDFIGEITHLHDAGVRTFIELGPSDKLTGLVRSILEDTNKPHHAMALDAGAAQRTGAHNLARLLAQLAALGYSVNLAKWDDSYVAPAAKPPGMTVQLTGANYVKPRESRPPTRRAGGVSPPSPTAGVSVNPKATPVQNAPIVTASPVSPKQDPLGGLTPPRSPAPATLPTPAIPSPTPRPNALTQSNSPLAHALQATQQSIVALQQMQQQTADLHRRFLEGQETAQLSVLKLVEQQQILLQSQLGLPLSTPTAPLTAHIQPPTPPERLRFSGSVPTPTPIATPAPAPAPITPAPIAHTPTPVPLSPALLSVPSPAPLSPALFTDALLAVVAEKTGYPTEMLELSMNLDSDLGIDSIKRVEILSALQEKLPDAPIVKPEDLGNFHTLQDIINFLGVTTSAPAASGLADSPTCNPTTSAPACGLASTSAAHFTDALLSVVAEKTGYPTEMLELSMNLDSDLGIDSIKRVEILSALQEKLPDAPVVKPEDLGNFHTLQDIINFLTTGQTDPTPSGPGGNGPQGKPANAPADPVPALAASPGSPAAPITASAHTGLAPAQGPAVSTGGAGGRALPVNATIDRHVLSHITLPPNTRQRVALPAGSQIWITSDGTPLAAAIAKLLTADRLHPHVIDLAQVNTLSAPAALAGLIVLAPENNSTSDHDQFLKHAFQLVKLVGPALRHAAKTTGHAMLVTASRIDGAFGLDGIPPRNAHATGGLAGLAKTAAHEWPEVRCKAVDIAPNFASLDTLAVALHDEVTLAGPIEVGIAHQGRSALLLSPVSLAGRNGHHPLNKGDLVVITGGARGVTAQVALALAQAHKPTLLLLGRSVAPTPEPAWLASATTEAAMKKAILAHLDKSAGPPSPKVLNDEYKKVAANREVLTNIALLQKAGATVIYRGVDVRDETAVARIINEARKIHGPVRGLIHGAGVLADKRIEDKTTQQFDEVFSTKVVGLRSLLAAVANDDVRFMVMFSSSTGRFGRTGQVDYAIANEVLNKIAQQQARLRPTCRVVSMNWGPWDGGMVTPGLRKIFEDEGVGLIGLDAGAQALLHEIAVKPDRDVEVVILGGVKDASVLNAKSLPVQPPHAAPRPQLTPTLEFTVDPESFPVLRSHVIGGRAVVPVALTIEWLAHAAVHANPGLVFVGVDKLSVLKGITIDAGKSTAVRLLTGEPIAINDGNGTIAVPVEVQSLRASGPALIHTRASVILATEPITPDRARVTPRGLRASNITPTQAYATTQLFHGPDLQGITQIHGVSRDAIAVQAAPAPPPAQWLASPPRRTWLTDPLVIDCAFQALILWSEATHNMPSLPTGFDRLTLFRRAFEPTPTDIAAIITKQTAHEAVADIEFIDHAGKLIARIENYRCVLDASLTAAFAKNQLAAPASL